MSAIRGSRSWLGTKLSSAVSTQLRAENITIPDDAMAFQGQTVAGPLTAYVQADIKMKRECMKLLEQPSKPRRKPDPMRFSRLLSFLEAQ